MNIDAFLGELDLEVERALERIGERSSIEPGADLTVTTLLKVALKNELEATEESARWITIEKDLAVKLALARQCGDEARHYRLIEHRLRSLGSNLDDFDPVADGYSPMFVYLQSLGSTVERIAAGQFTREALAKVRNEVFIAFCESRRDLETARLYREVILPDEHHHHELGRRLLARFAVDEASQAKARAAAHRTLELAEELQETARMRHGITCAPGC